LTIATEHNTRSRNLVGQVGIMTLLTMLMTIMDHVSHSDFLMAADGRGSEIIMLFIDDVVHGSIIVDHYLLSAGGFE
jgi:hypothetical protein